MLNINWRNQLVGKNIDNLITKYINELIVNIKAKGTKSFSIKNKDLYRDWGRAGFYFEIAIKSDMDAIAEFEGEIFTLNSELESLAFLFNNSTGEFVKFDGLADYQISNVTGNVSDIGLACKVGLLSDLIEYCLGGTKIFETPTKENISIILNNCIEWFPKDSNDLCKKLDGCIGSSELLECSSDEDEVDNIFIEIDQILVFDKSENQEILVLIPNIKTVLESVEDGFVCKVDKFSCYDIADVNHEGYILQINGMVYVFDLSCATFVMVPKNDYEDNDKFNDNDINYLTILDCFEKIEVYTNYFGSKQEHPRDREILIINILIILDVINKPNSDFLYQDRYNYIKQFINNYKNN